MKQIQLLSIAAAVMLCLAGAAQASDVKVIANASISASQLSADDLKAVFLAAKTSLADGSAVEPVLVKSGPAHDEFLRTYVGKTDAALTAYLRSLVFTGKASMPKTCDSEAEVVAYVAKTRGAIGYVSAATPTGATKTLVIR
jgi:ABC-type phosphate transport system substrate-binding protein